VSCQRLHGTGVVNSSVLNDPLGEPGRTSLYVGLGGSMWGSTGSDHFLSPCVTGELLNWELPRDIEFMKALGMGISIRGGPVGERGGGPPFLGSLRDE
jgi:hypothetical protein